MQRSRFRPTYSNVVALKNGAVTPGKLGDQAEKGSTEARGEAETQGALGPRGNEGQRGESGATGATGASDAYVALSDGVMTKSWPGWSDFRSN